jgi:hypothetical protein
MFAGSLIFYAHSKNALGFTIHGNLTYATYRNTFIGCGGVHNNGAGFYHGNAQSNLFIHSSLTRFSGTGVGHDVQGATALGGSTGASRNNIWIDGSPGQGGITLRGTDSYSYTNGAMSNEWIRQEFVDSVAPTIGTNALFQWSGNGVLRPGGIGTPNTTAQSLTAAVDTVITGTSILLPQQGIQLGAVFRFKLNVAKTAGANTWSVRLRFGTLNTTADTQVALWTSTTNTAITDNGSANIEAVVTATGASAAMLCFASGTKQFGTNAQGLGIVSGAPSATATFNSASTNPGPAYLHVDVTSGAGAVMTARGSAELLKSGT